MNTTDYTTYTADDFVTDDKFIHWCLSPTLDENHFWDTWLDQHPDQRQDILIAQKIILDLHNAQNPLDNTILKAEIWQNISDNINERQEKTVLYYIKRLSGIAAMLLILLIAYQWLTPSVYNPNEEWVSQTNTSQSSLSIYLSDGTKLELQPMATIHYPEKFNDNKRELILQGEAFFDVARDESKPFLIYAQQTLTKVLGTSFNIRSEKGEDVEVEVSSGKVAVFKHLGEGLASDDNPALSQTINPSLDIKNNTDYKILTPNQKVVFKQKEKILIKTIVEVPKLMQKIEELPKTRFINTSLVDVFSSIEKAYGIEVEYNEQLKSCTISTIIGQETMLIQLQMICIALDLKMVESDGIIQITGNGCDKK